MPIARRRMLLLLLSTSLLGCAQTAPPEQAPTLTDARIAQVVASPDRSAADRRNDERRKPAAMLAFIGIRPGITALDVSTGGGYTAELLARAIGPGGTVYAQSPPRDPALALPQPALPEGGQTAAPAPAARPPRSSADALAERQRNLDDSGTPVARIAYVEQPFESPAPPARANGGLDLVTLMFNYHDLGYLGVDRAQMNRAVFAALKSGGIYVIADHAGRPGTGISESGTLHRIEEKFLRREVEAAGFQLAAEGDFLRNPNDPRDQPTAPPPQSKDEFVLKFVKP